MRKFGMSLVAALFATAGFAQDRDGNDTAGDWVNTHYATYGLWDLACDERAEGDGVEQRCYLRYVDVFSPNPNFGALFSFVNMTADGPTLDFGIERGTRFADDGFKITNDGQDVWVQDSILCLTLRQCFYDPDEAGEVLQVMQGGGEMHFAFSDRHGIDQDLSWDLSDFSRAMDDLKIEADKRAMSSS